MNKKILIIENEKESRLLLKEILEEILKLGTVKEAKEGMKGVGLAISEKPGIIFCDVELPDISGLELIRQLRNNPAFKRTRIIAISANHSHKNAVPKVRINALLKKPFELSDVQVSLVA